MSEKYNQAFFLDLAAKGKDTWNAWRRDPTNKDVRVTFTGTDFSEAPKEINFDGFEFGDGADFSGCKWQRVFFDQANFGHEANFSRATFDHRVYFRAATFGHFTDFGNATFNDLANFAGTTFGNGASFGSGSFNGTSAIFIGARFGSLADFSGATFNPTASFDSAIFQGSVDFSGLPEARFAEKLERSLGPPPDEKSAQARKALEARHRSFWKRHGCQPDRFLDISFAKAQFDGEANFFGRTFEAAADFTNTRFYRPPIFEDVTGVHRIDFTGAHIGFVPPGKFHCTKDSQVPVRLRQLRKLAEDTKNHDLERDLYIEERKAERGVYWRQLVEELKKAPIMEKPLIALRLGGHLLWIVVMFFYWALANYGRSFGRPFALFVASGLFFYWSYEKILEPFIPKACPLADKYEYAVRMFALGNAVPVIGPLTIDGEMKKLLYCPGGDGNCLPIWFQLLVVWQNLFSIILVFFIGLALRNYFKIK